MSVPSVHFPHFFCFFLAPFWAYFLLLNLFLEAQLTLETVGVCGLPKHLGVFWRILACFMFISGKPRLLCRNNSFQAIITAAGLTVRVFY